MKIKLNDIRIDGGTQSRKVIDQETVYNYLDNMKDGAEFPKMDVSFDGATYWLVDGFHRYQAYKILGLREIEVEVTNESLPEAQVASFGVNGYHGKPRTVDDKRNAVEMALAHPLTKDKSQVDIAKICNVSRSFVASVISPSVKEKQNENKKRSILKKAEEIRSNTDESVGNEESKCSPTTLPEKTASRVNPTTGLSEPDPYAGEAPDEEELKAAELAMQADIDTLHKLLESDDALATAHEEIKRLNQLNANLEVRLHSLMTEKNEAIKMVKKLQKENDKLKAKK